MAGVIKGASSRILQAYPKALYTHCGAHKLNLVLGDSCQLLPIVKMLTTVNEVATFFSASAKRMSMLEGRIPESQKGMRPKLMCPTRWSSRQMSLNSFVDLIIPMVETMHAMSEIGDSQTRCQAASLSGIHIDVINEMFMVYRTFEFLFSASLTNGFEFLVALMVGKFYFNLTFVLSKQLQSSDVDFVQAMLEVKNLLNLFQGNVCSM